MPKPLRASTTALTMHGAEPMVPASPTPLAPSALTGVGVTVRRARSAGSRSRAAARSP